MSTKKATPDGNAELARKINREARNNPNSPYAGKYVGIAHGQVVVASTDLNEVLTAVNEAAPNRKEGLIIDASADYEGPHQIWSL